MRYRFAVVVLVVLSLVLASAMPALADASTAVQWLKSLQRQDGGFGAQSSSLSETAEVIFALAAARQDVAGLTANGNSPLDYLAANLAAATSTGEKAKVSMAVSAAGADASNFGGTNLVADIEQSQTAEGMYGGGADTLTGHVYAMLALASAGRPIPRSAVDWLKGKQADSGAWAWSGSGALEDVDSNTTALALEALIAAGVANTDAAVQSGLQYLRGIQNADGGFPYQNPSPWGTDTDANSTAVVIQALIATGQDMAAWQTADGKVPLDALASLQRNDGAFAWQASVPDANLFATAQAVPALLGVAYPIAISAVSEEAAPAAAETVVAPASTAEVQAEVATPEAAATPAQVLPETGGASPTLPLVLAGLALIAGGVTLQRKLTA